MLAARLGNFHTVGHTRHLSKKQPLLRAADGIVASLVLCFETENAEKFNCFLIATILE
jgi:hypothetical protein